MKLLTMCFALIAATLLAANLHAAQIKVFAAASLTDSLKQIAAAYEKQATDKIMFNFGASGTLSRQIEEGAPADIFFAADEAKADALTRKGFLVNESRKSLLGNTLVLIVAPEDAQIHTLMDLTNASIRRVAIGDVNYVPVGTYSKQYLEKLGLWTTMEMKMVPCESVRAVLAAVESGNVAAGLVYKTDAAISKKVKVAFEVPLAEGPKISYPLALIKDSPQSEAAKRFYEYLFTENSRNVFKQYGFIVLERPNIK